MLGKKICSMVVLGAVLVSGKTGQSNSKSNTPTAPTAPIVQGGTGSTKTSTPTNLA